MRPPLKKYTQANREAWNEVMPRHQEAARAKWDDAFLRPGFACMDEVELGQLRKMGIKGKTVAHLCCNNGVELLSLKNLGAGMCVGFDISDAAIQEARERAQLCRIDCQFVRTDVYDIAPEYEDRFDVVYISAGGLGWIPDLKLFFAKAAALMQENGRVFIHEIHPFSEMLPFDDSKEADPLRIVDSYFQAEPIVEYGGLDYVGGSKYVSSKPQYWFVHTVSDILMSLIGNGISLEHFSEYEVDVSAGHKRVEEARLGIPLSYILIGRKQNKRCLGIV
jgi:ubiquinone/menaquinone biosynthesis C-methylase UbiE